MHEKEQNLQQDLNGHAWCNWLTTHLAVLPGNYVKISLKHMQFAFIEHDLLYNPTYWFMALLAKCVENFHEIVIRDAYPYNRHLIFVCRNLVEFKNRRDNVLFGLTAFGINLDVRNKKFDSCCLNFPNLIFPCRLRVMFICNEYIKCKFFFMKFILEKVDGFIDENRVVVKKYVALSHKFIC